MDARRIRPSQVRLVSDFVPARVLRLSAHVEVKVSLAVASVKRNVILVLPFQAL